MMMKTTTMTMMALNEKAYNEKMFTINNVYNIKKLTAKYCLQLKHFFNKKCLKIKQYIPHNDLPAHLPCYIVCADI